MPMCLASCGEEFNLGPGMRLDHSKFCINFFSSIKEVEKASDIDIRSGQKEYPPASF